MMDHYYDKLLQVNNIVIIKMYVCNLFCQIAVFPTDVVQCPYLFEEAQRRVKPLVEICLEASKRGEAPVDLIESHM